MYVPYLTSPAAKRTPRPDLHDLPKGHSHWRWSGILQEYVPARPNEPKGPRTFYEDIIKPNKPKYNPPKLPYQWDKYFKY